MVRPGAATAYHPNTPGQSCCDVGDTIGKEQSECLETVPGHDPARPSAEGGVEASPVPIEPEPRHAMLAHVGGARGRRGTSGAGIRWRLAQMDPHTGGPVLSAMVRVHRSNAAPPSPSAASVGTMDTAPLAPMLVVVAVLCGATIGSPCSAHKTNRRGNTHLLAKGLATVASACHRGAPPPPPPTPSPRPAGASDENDRQARQAVLPPDVAGLLERLEGAARGRHAAGTSAGNTLHAILLLLYYYYSFYYYYLILLHVILILIQLHVRHCN